jgi:hypothetical protein
MWVLVATCDNCASVHRLPPQSILIRYGENEHSFHFKRADAALDSTALALPREVREKSITLPFCEACFITPEPSIEEIHDNGHGTYFPGDCPECAALRKERGQ